MVDGLIVLVEIKYRLRSTAARYGIIARARGTLWEQMARRRRRLVESGG